MKLIAPFVALFALVPAAQAATAWQGWVALNLTGPGIPSRLVNCSVREGLLHADLLGGNNGSRLIDPVKKELIMIAPDGMTYTRRPSRPPLRSSPGCRPKSPR